MYSINDGILMEMVLATDMGRWNKLSLILACSPGFDCLYVLGGCIGSILLIFLCSKTIMMELWIIFLIEACDLNHGKLQVCSLCTQQ